MQPGTFKPAPAFPFIPKYITSSRSHDNPPKYDYVVMEYAGINVKEWFRLDTKDGNAASPLRPDEEEIKRLVARTYWILKALHKAGYRHGDNHYRNWALSLTNPKVIFLFDFGRTKPLNGEYTWIARDWYLWADMVKSASMKIPFDKEMKPHRNWLAKLAKGLMTHLEKVLWRNPDNPVEQNAPYQELQAANHEAALALPGLKEFTKEAEDFAKTIDGAALDAKKDLYRWKPE